MEISLSKLPVLAILGGTGKEGPGLAMRWALAGYHILIGSRSLEKAQATAALINQSAGVDTVQGMENSQAARLGEICILTVIQSAHQQVLASLREDLQGKILVDATARVDFRDPQAPPAPSAARQAQDLLGQNVRVVAAFQNVPAHVLKNNVEGMIETDVLVCADDPDAAQQVIQLAKAARMHAYYAGNLDLSHVVEGLTAILISMNKHYGLKTASIKVTGVDRL
jgi:NADPH-dependent F420 reductase